jgi:hypothetical protein
MLSRSSCHLKCVTASAFPFCLRQFLLSPFRDLPKPAIAGSLPEIGDVFLQPARVLLDFNLGVSVFSVGDTPGVSLMLRSVKN